MVSCPAAASHVTAAAYKDQATNEKAAEVKQQKYQELCDELDQEFLPLPFETFGAMGASVRDIIRRCRRRLSDDRGEWDVSWSTRNFGTFFSQLLACSLQRGSARSVLRLLSAGDRREERTLGSSGIGHLLPSSGGSVRTASPPPSAAGGGHGSTAEPPA